MTDSDYPAAHSMDTTWYAVDADGHVGVFDTAENGHAPIWAEGDFSLNRLYWERHADADPYGYSPDEEVAADLGFFLYEHGDGYDPIDVFERRVAPARPVHVEELPPQVRAACKKTRLAVAFAAAERVQPLEHLPCAYWYDEDRCAFLAADGVTVRPVRGKEARVAEFVRQFRETFPDQVARYRFEGPADGR
jgi:hypothetical protein